MSSSQRFVGLAHVASWFGAAVSAVLLLVLGFWLSHALTADSPGHELKLTPSQLQVTAGSGGLTSAGLEVRSAGPRQFAVVQAAIKEFDAAAYETVRVDVEGISPKQKLKFIWSTKAANGAIYERDLPLGPDGVAQLDLGGLDEWAGQVVAVGLVVVGSVAGPFVVHGFEFEQRPRGFVAEFQRTLSTWFQRSPWSEKSINLVEDAGARVPLLVALALWCVLASFCFIAIAHLWRLNVSPTPFVLFLVVGWLAADVRWQSELLHRLAQTKERFAGLAAEERYEVADDAAVYRAVHSLVEKLPSTPARIFLVATTANAYVPGRIRYHLASQDVSVGLTSLPDPQVVRPGDFILLVLPLANVEYDESTEQLVSRGRSLPARLVYGLPRQMALFQVTQGT